MVSSFDWLLLILEEPDVVVYMCLPHVKSGPYEIAFMNVEHFSKAISEILENMLKI